MALTIRNIILCALLIATLFYEPTFKLFLNLLINFHIFSRITFVIARTLVHAHFPKFASFTTAMFYELRTFVSQQYAWATSRLATLGHVGLVRLVNWTIIWLKESPRWLCEMNEFIVDIGEGAVWKLQGDDGGKTMEDWVLAAETAAEFCAGVRAKR